MLNIKNQISKDLKYFSDISKDLGVQFLIFDKTVQLYVCSEEVELNFDISNEDAIEDLVNTLDLLYKLKTIKGKYK